MLPILKMNFGIMTMMLNCKTIFIMADTKFDNLLTGTGMALHIFGPVIEGVSSRVGSVSITYLWSSV